MVTLLAAVMTARLSTLAVLVLATVTLASPWPSDTRPPPLLLARASPSRADTERTVTRLPAVIRARRSTWELTVGVRSANALVNLMPTTAPLEPFDEATEPPVSAG